MKFNLKYLWAYLLVVGLVMMLLPNVVGLNFDEEGSSPLALPAAVLSYFSVPIFMTGVILGIVQVIAMARRSSPVPVEHSDQQLPPDFNLPPVAQQGTQDAKSNTGTSAGLITMVVGVVVAFFPLLIATFSTQNGHNMWNESDPSSGAAALWLMIITLPVGGIVAIVGFVTLIISAARKN